MRHDSICIYEVPQNCGFSYIDIIYHDVTHYIPSRVPVILLFFIWFLLSKDNYQINLLLIDLISKPTL
jgi:hypothetical protein